MDKKLIRHRAFSNVYYENSLKEKQIEQIQQRNSQDDYFEAVGEIIVDARNKKHILILNLADIHYGDEGFKRDKFITTLNWAKDTGCMVTMLGDSMGLATAQSSTNVQTYQTNNESSRLGLEKDLEIIDGQVVVIIPGNHTAKHGNRCKVMGLCAERPVADHLGVPYYPYHALIDILTNNGHYYVGLTHGDMAHDYQTVAKKLITIIQQEKNVIVDAVLMGHYHKIASFDQVHDYSEYDETLRTYVRKHKTITVESLPAFQELNQHAAANGFTTTPANARAMDFILDEDGHISNVITFNILDDEGNLTVTAKKYQECLRTVDKETLKQQLRKKYAKKLANAKTDNLVKKIADEMIEGE